MSIVTNADRPLFSLPGIEHRTLAGADDGLGRLELWQQSLAPGAVTPTHYHDSEEAIVVLTGRGTLVVDGQRIPFAAGQTLVVPPRVVHQIINDGPEAMALLAVFSESPARVFAPDGTLIPVPWYAPRG